MTVSKNDPKHYLTCLQFVLRMVQSTPELHDAIRASVLDGVLDFADARLDPAARAEQVAATATAFDALMRIAAEDSPRRLAETVSEAHRAVETAL